MRDKTRLIMEARARQWAKLLREHRRNQAEPSGEELFGPWREGEREARAQREAEVWRAIEAARQNPLRLPPPGDG